MKKIIGLTAISLAIGAAATFGSVASAQWGGGWDGFDGDWNDGTTVVVRCGDNDRCGGWNNNRCGWNNNRCGWNRCGWNSNRCGWNRCGVGGWGMGWDGGWY